mgnify:CR=1 FL=1
MDSFTGHQVSSWTFLKRFKDKSKENHENVVIQVKNSRCEETWFEKDLCEKWKEIADLKLVQYCWEIIREGKNAIYGTSYNYREDKSINGLLNLPLPTAKKAA